MKTLIGITGLKGTGKSTLAEMLKQEIEGAEIVAFADALRDEVNTMLNLVDAEAEDHPCGTVFMIEDGNDLVSRQWLEDRKGTVFGPLLQGHGSFRREWNGPDYWVRRLAEYIEHRQWPVIIPDVRYENEAEFIKSQGGLLVAIYGPSRWADDQRDQQHPSEANVDKVRQMADIVFGNDGDMKMLRGHARVIANIAKHLVPELVTP